MTASTPWPRTVRRSSPEGDAARLPIIVAEWPRNSRELIRISLDHFNTCFTIDIRCWWRDPKGIFRPGRDGLTLAVEHLPKLVDVLKNALERAKMLGLIEPKGTTGTATERQRRHR